MAPGSVECWAVPGVVERWLFPGISKILLVSHIIRYGLLSQESAESMQYRVGPVLFSYFFLLVREKSHVYLVYN